MLMIRFQKVGRKHEPVFRLVLTDSKNGPQSGKFLEVLGNMDARRGDKAVIDEEKVKNWISKGAKLSDTVHNLLVDKKIISGKKINVLPKKAPIKSEAEIEAEKKAAETSKAEQTTTPTVEPDVETSVNESVETPVEAPISEEAKTE